MLPKILPNMIAQHADGATIALLMRPRLLASSDADMSDLLELDQEVLAHFEGLALAGQTGWDLACERLAASPDPASLGSVAYLSVQTDQDKRIAFLSKEIGESGKMVDGAATAMAFYGADYAAQLIPFLLSRSEAPLQTLGYALSRLIGRYHVDEIRAGLQGPATVCKRAIILAGLGDVQEVEPDLQKLAVGDQSVRHAQTVTLALLRRTADEALIDVAMTTGEMAELALIALARLTPPDAIPDLVRSVEDDRSREDLACRLCGMSGVDSTLPFLVRMMEAPDAAQAFFRVTGQVMAKLINHSSPPQPNPFDPTPTPERLPAQQQLIEWVKHRKATSQNPVPLYGEGLQPSDIATLLRSQPLADHPLITFAALIGFGLVPKWGWRAPAHLQFETVK